MTITALLMAGLLAFVLLVPTLMVAVLVSGVARRPALAETEPTALQPQPAQRQSAELQTL